MATALGSRHPRRGTTASDSPTVELSIEERDQLLRAQGRAAWHAARPAWTEAGWWDTALRPEVRMLMRLPKGPTLLAAVQQVGAVDGSRCAFPHVNPGALLEDAGVAPGTPGNPCACQVILAAAWATAAAFATEQADASVLHCLGAGEHAPLLNPSHPDLGRIVDPGVELLAPALRRSPDSVRTLIAKLRRRATAASPVLVEAIRDGLLPAWQADLLLQDLMDLEPAGADMVIDAVVCAMRRRHDRGWVAWTFSDLRRHAKRVKARLADELRKAREERHAHDRVDRQLCGDGRGRLIADLPADVVHRIYQRITALARGVAADDPDDERSLDSIRADVLTDLLLDTPSPDPAAASGEVAVLIALDTLRGRDDAPADIPGADIVPAAIGRELAADRKWRAWLTDATGTVVATSRTTYTPTAAVARAVRAREPHCRMPGCRRSRLDLDHVQPFPDGLTDPHNLAGLCRRHHRMKTHQNWGLVNDTPTEFTWTDPNGIRLTDHHDPPL